MYVSGTLNDNKNKWPVPSSECIKEMFALIPLRILLANPTLALKCSYSWQTMQYPPPRTPTHPHTPHTRMRSRQMFAAGWPVCCRAAWLHRGGHAVTRTQESGLNSRHSLGFEAALVLSGLHLLQLILHLACVVRALCQTHRLWKNNLTGFNLPPPLPTPPPPPLPPLAFFFRSFCVPLRGTEPILFGSSTPLPASFAT